MRLQIQKIRREIQAAPLIDRLLGGFYSLLMLGIVMLTVFSHVQAADYYRRTYQVNRFLLLLIGAMILLLLAVVSRLVHFDGRYTAVKLGVATAILFLLQVLFIRAMLFETPWDVGTVIGTARMIAAEGYTPEQYTTDYFNCYPNNRLLIITIAELTKLLRNLGLSTNASQYQAMVILQAILYDLTGVLLFSLVRQLSHSVQAAWTAWMIYAVWIGLSPWLIIFYTDSNGILFPVLLLWMYLRLQDRPYYVRWVLIGIVGGLAYHIKATNGVLIIALLMVDAYRRFQLRKAIIKKAAIAVLILGIGISGVSKIGDLAYEHVTGVQIDYERNIGMLHYVKMGLNKESTGTFNSDDDDYSMWARTRKERNLQNLAEAARRASDLGPGGVAWLYTRKTTTNYSDGSFGFALDGTDFIETDYATVDRSDGGIDDGRLEALKALIRSVWRPDGMYFDWYVHAAHGVWLALLALTIPAGWLCIRERQYLPLLLTLIGAWMFTMIFESQQRYLFIFAPLYIATAICAAWMIWHQIVKS